MGELKTGRPNKRQRGQIERQRAAWTKSRNVKARERREKVKDWVSNAVEELKEDQAYIAAYGLEGYCNNSIAKLEELKSGGSGTNEGGDTTAVERNNQSCSLGIEGMVSQTDCLLHYRDYCLCV